MSVTWESHQQAETNGLPEGVGGLVRRSAPCSVRPSQEQDTEARVAAKKAWEIIAVTDKDGRVTIRQRGADTVAVGRGAGAMSADGEEKNTEPGSCKVGSGSQSRAERATNLPPLFSIGNYQTKVSEVVKADNYHQESLEDWSFSVFNINRASGLGGALVVVIVLLLTTPRGAGPGPF